MLISKLQQTSNLTFLNQNLSLIFLLISAALMHFGQSSRVAIVGHKVQTFIFGTDVGTELLAETK